MLQSRSLLKQIFTAAVCVGLTIPVTLGATDSDPGKQKKIRYKAGKQVDFDKQTIQGELRRPEISVVTGNEKTTDNGILRLREDFVDRITAHAAEEIE